jgi:hypothetical protein
MSYFTCMTCVQAEADAVAKPYAAGILELAQEKDILENVYNDLIGLQVRSDSSGVAVIPENNQIRPWMST